MHETAILEKRIRKLLGNCHKMLAEVAPRFCEELYPPANCAAQHPRMCYTIDSRPGNGPACGQTDFLTNRRVLPMLLKNETLDTIHSRRSCRAYTAQPVEADKLDTVIDAGLWAASGMGRQSPVIVAVQDKDTIAELSAINAKIMGNSGDPFYGASTVLVVLAHSEVRTAVEDGSLVMGNLMLAAESIGLASCWIHRARETFETGEGKQLLKKWGLDPDAYIGVGNCILGYAAEGGRKPAADRKEGRVVYVT